MSRTNIGNKQSLIAQLEVYTELIENLCSESINCWLVSGDSLDRGRIVVSSLIG